MPGFLKVENAWTKPHIYDGPGMWVKPTFEKGYNPFNKPHAVMTTAPVEGVDYIPRRKEPTLEKVAAPTPPTNTRNSSTWAGGGRGNVMFA